MDASISPTGYTPRHTRRYPPAFIELAMHGGCYNPWMGEHTHALWHADAVSPLFPMVPDWHGVCVYSLLVAAAERAEKKIKVRRVTADKATEQRRNTQ